MKMVTLTQCEARFILDQLDTVEHAEYEQDDINRAIEILEECIVQPQEITIPDGSSHTVPPKGDEDTRMV